MILDTFGSHFAQQIPEAISHKAAAVTATDLPSQKPSKLQGDQKKNRTPIFLTEIHRFNSSLFFFSGYEVESAQEKLGP